MGLFDKEKKISQKASIQASKILMDFYSRSHHCVTQKPENKGPVTAADIQSHRIIVKILAENFPDDAILSEEGGDDRSRLKKSRVWLVDPLDGTRNFIQKREEFAIHIGLSVDHNAVFGFVYLPVSKTSIWGNVRQGAFFERHGRIQGLECSKEIQKQTVLMRSRHHFSDQDESYSKKINPDKVIHCGSVGRKAFELAQNHCSLFFYSGVLSEWDTCAPEVIVRAAGGIVTDFYGNPLSYNQPEPVSPQGVVFVSKTLQKSYLSFFRS